MVAVQRFSGILMQKLPNINYEHGQVTHGRLAHYNVTPAPYCFSLQGSDVFAVLSDKEDALKAMGRQMGFPAIFIPTPELDRRASEGVMLDRSRELDKEWKAKPGEEVVFEALA